MFLCEVTEGKERRVSSHSGCLLLLKLCFDSKHSCDHVEDREDYQHRVVSTHKHTAGFYM